MHRSCPPEAGPPLAEKPELKSAQYFTTQYLLWKGGRAVECTGLENRSPFTGTVGPNPTLSAIKIEEVINGLKEDAQAVGAVQRHKSKSWRLRYFSLAMPMPMVRLENYLHFIR